MKLGRRLVLLLIVTVALLFLAMFAMKAAQFGGDARQAVRSMFEPVREPLIRFLKRLLALLEA